MVKKSKWAKQEKRDPAVALPEEVDRKIFYFIMVLAPILFFVLLELCLRFFNYGADYKQWVESPNGQWLSEHGKYLILNPEIARKYFHTLKHIPVSNEEAFDKVKKGNAFRVFVLGESSGAGFPYEPNGSFSRYLKDRLSLAYPDSRIEVINCSMTAISSYTLRNLIPGILEEKPDLILIYAGHNEYYGALGAGSVESLGNFRPLVNFTISLEKYRTYQLMRNALGWIGGIVSGGKETSSGTMMEEMVRDKYIPYKSVVYEKGLSQFEGNMADILEMIKKADVPVIIGTLACNLKDQPPFVSDSSTGYPAAERIYEEGKSALSQKNFADADSLFRRARDLDELRFRAPGGMNDIIHDLGQKYEIPILDIDSAFDASSPDHITGNNLMVDHLHPTLHGYQLMGKLFFDKMERVKYLPDTKPRNLPDGVQDSLVLSNFPFSRLDSVIAEYKIIVLKNNWPFANNAMGFSYPDFIRPATAVDSLAAQFVEQKVSWKNDHLFAAQKDIDGGNLNGFLSEMNVLIDQYPYMTDYYKLAAQTLIRMQNFQTARDYLQKACEIEPDAYVTKWLGIIGIYDHQLDSAGLFLNQSLAFDNGDAQVWLNLAAICSNTDKNKSLQLVDEALALDPNYKEALDMRRQLMKDAK